ncbi:MAG: glutathione S-transferase family protein [Rhodospirillaceae bacterium]
MKLFYSPIHAFAHKVLITAHEAGVWDQIEPVAVYPFREGFDITVLNPLNKVPTLTLSDGAVLYGSQAIVEYIDSLAPSGRALYPEIGPQRWDALRRLALADLVFDTATQLTMDGDYSDKPRVKFIEWHWPKVERCLAALNQDAKADRAFDIGDAATLHALTYIDLIVPNHVPAPIPRDYNWRTGNESLEAWFDKTIKRPSVQFHFQKDYGGDISAKNCAAKVQEVLALR